MVGEEGREPTAQLGLAFFIGETKKFQNQVILEKTKKQKKTQSPPELQGKKKVKKRQKDN